MSKKDWDLFYSAEEEVKRKIENQIKYIKSDRKMKQEKLDFIVKIKWNKCKKEFKSLIREK